MTEGSARVRFFRFAGTGGIALSAVARPRAHPARRWAAAGGICLLLVACGSQLPRFPAGHESRRLEADFDQAWVAANRVLAERGQPIEAADRTSGILETEWQTFNPEYAATVFVTQHEDRYASCGKPGLGEAFRGKQVRLELALTAARPRETQLVIQARFRTHLWSDPLVWQGTPRGTVECRSRGRLEEEMALQIQFQLIGEQLERLRRGIP